MKSKSCLGVFVSICLLAAACGVSDHGGATGVDKVFAEMENGLRNADEASFRKHWHSEGYENDLVGEGLSGSNLYRQGSRKKWFPNPDRNGKQTVGKVLIVPAKLYAWEKERDVDEIYFAIAGGKVLGGGEELENVKKLAERFNNGESLKQ